MLGFLGLRQLRVIPGAYRYQPLRFARETRFIKLKPSLARTDDIFCEFVHYVLPPGSQICEYEALSYSWGYPTLTKSIKVRGPVAHVTDDSAWFDLNITPALHAALQRLRYHSQERTLWIDAICINQGDLREKKNQVLMMGDIYTRAKSVPIWLGGEEETTPRAIEAAIGSLKLLHHMVAQSHSMEPNEPGSLRLLPIVTSFVLADELEGSNNWAALATLFRRPWFQRIWVVQEAVNAQKPVFMWGEHTIEWEVLELAASSIKICQSYAILPAERIDRGIHSVTLMNSLREATEHTLFSLLMVTRSYQTSEPRDKVYALLGLASPNSELNPSYEDDVDSIYTKIANGFLTDNISYLSAVWAEEDPSKSSLPSWVPDLRRNKLPDLLLSFFGKFSATKGIESTFRISYDQKVLFIRGKIIDEIKVIGSEFLPLPSNEDRELNGMQIMDQARTNMVTSFEQAREIFMTQILEGPIDNESLLQFSQAMTCNRRVDGGILSNKQYEEFQAFTKYYTMDPKVFRDTKDRAMQLLHIEAGYYEGNLRQWCRGRAFFASLQKRPGWAPPAAKPGDVICVLFGAPVPVVLRPIPEGKGYYLLGECYLHGMMEGEALDRPDLTDTEFMIV